MLPNVFPKVNFDKKSVPFEIRQKKCSPPPLSKQIPIQHNCRNWTTLFLDYTSHDLANTAEFTYILDNDPMMQGSFTLQCPKMTLGRTYIGARKDGTKAFAGALHGLEIYHTQSPKPIPQALKDLIIKTQQIKKMMYMVQHSM